jgi:ElaB/YqjD/DUF883 family membrane-anchored ribosome-binding protein
MQDMQSTELNPLSPRSAAMSHSPSHNRVREVEGKVKEQAASVAEQAGSIAGNVQQMASDAADRVRETASDVLAQGKARASDAMESVGDRVHEYPGSSLLVAAGIGFLVGFFWRRS